METKTEVWNGTCPFCGNENTEWYDEQWEDGILYEDRRCCECEETFTVCYELVSIGVRDRHNNTIIG